MLVKRDLRETPFVGVSEADLDFEAELSGVPTPRGIPWSNDHLTSTDDMPVVTAKKEPTQRGLGIPPPPSASEVDWREKMPSISSLSPLTVDTFDAGTSAPRSSMDAGDMGTSSADIDSTENERITVRAPAPGATPRQRRRAMAVPLAAAAVLLLCLFARRATFEPERASVAEVKPMLQVAAVAPPAAPALRIVANTAPPTLQKAIEPLPVAVPAPSTAAEPKAAASVVAPSPEPKADKKRRARTERRSTELEAAVPGSELVDPWRSGQPSGTPNRPVFSLPPR